MENRLKVVVVDDEKLAREKIIRHLSKEDDFEIAAECADGEAAVTAIRKIQPDLVFLDVQMPELDGFGVLNALPASEWPVTIFVTAYDKYALKAFEVHALDYLLKPFDQARFEKTLRRARSHLSKEKGIQVNRRLISLLDDLGKERHNKTPKYTDRFVVKSMGRVFFLKSQEIDWIEAAGNYVRFHVGRESHLLRETMNVLQGKLDPEQFIRVHRSFIIRIEQIKEMKPWFNGEYVFLLKSGKKLTSSRTYRGELSRLLDG